ncbi:MAG: bifunctional diaminohydroxyphosphoribosylaminopyrimidine deaminase/5-amino-6-(5-phosphoribosylamino)uracil reductase RibD [Desulfamplus sp.]|nr:bifunctional diaminohydroxyphosphoribosylaminopyrimidine deaminase/5-amino-6-(5-phosphoribosylamino)uracil reductase RibD [Desulfamplus sp.]
MDDVRYMKEALALAAKGRGYTSPNPMVGAVVVKENKIVGRGWHRAAGLAHAEVEAINDAGDNVAGSDIYVTLEPCNHYGKTPPCTKKIIDAGIKRVVVASPDPNPFVTGGGVQYLREHGIKVELGVCREEAETLIEDFIWYVQNDKKPFVILKCASTLDGRLATSTGDSRWITCEKSRQFVHELRHAYDAILVGSGTLHKDNPSLTARIDGFDKTVRDPHRIILDSNLSIDLNAKILTQKSSARTIIAASSIAVSSDSDSNHEKRTHLESMGITLLTVPENAHLPSQAGYLKQEKNFLDFDNLLKQLGKMGIMSILIEGGATVIGSALSSGIVNKVLFFMAPKILGGDDGVPVCRGKSPLFMKDAFQLKKVDMTRFDDDILIQGYLK